MNTFYIRLIAIITMLIDHIGLFFFPQMTGLRIIGRLAFPLFAWLIANGAIHTKNIRAYQIRLFLFALGSQIPYYLANTQKDPSYRGLNVFFILAMGLVAIEIYKKTEDKKLALWLVMVMSLIAYLLRIDYGAIGILSILTFYVHWKDMPKIFLIQSLLFIVPYLIPLAEQLGVNNKPIDISYYIQPLALLALPVISLYNNKQGPKTQYLFYSFYPGHLLVIYLIKTYLMV